MLGMWNGLEYNLIMICTIIIAVILSIVLYLAGVFSGLYASKMIEARTQEDIADLKQSTKEDLNVIKVGTEEQLNYMSQYIDFLETNLKTMQFEQSFELGNHRSISTNTLPSFSSL